MTYEQTRNVNLPWGYWLRVQSGPGSISYVDEAGRKWPSVRAAFWQGRLGMAPHNERNREEQLEMLLATLAASDRQRRHPVENTLDLHDGSVRLYRLYRYWLQSIGLIGDGLNGDPFDGRTTPEGLAVVKMLLATRTPELHGAPIGAEAIRMMAGAPEAGDVTDLQRLAAFEVTAAARLANAFVRRNIGRVPVIALDHRDGAGLMPIVRTIWSVDLADGTSRDALYAWLVARVDRWDHWGSIAFRSGGAALTARLIALLAVGLNGRTTPRPDVIALPGPDRNRG